MTDDEIKAARALCDAATPAPWRISPAAKTTDREPRIWVTVGMGNAAFIAAARELVPRLLDEVERLRAELHDVLAERDAIQSIATQLERELSGKTKLLDANTDAYAYLKSLLARYEPVIAAARYWAECDGGMDATDIRDEAEGRLYDAVDALNADEGEGR